MEKRMERGIPPTGADHMQDGMSGCMDPDRAGRRSMEQCAAFLAKMIIKYGDIVLKEIEEEEKLQEAEKKEERSPAVD